MGEYRIKVVVEGEGGAEVERMGTAVKKVGREVEGLDSRLRTVFNTVDRIGRRMMLVGTGIVGGLGALAVVGAKSRGEFEKAEEKLKTFLKSADKVKEAVTWAEAKEFKTPFDETQIMNTIAAMDQYGLDYKLWFETIGNTAVATTKTQEEAAEKSERLAKALGAVMTGQKRGFTTLAREFPELLSKAGLEVDETTEGWAKMVARPEEAVKKLKNYMDTEFGGAMERMSKTSETTMFRVKDVFSDALREATIPALTMATAKLRDFVAFIQTPVGKAKMEAAVKSLGEMFTTATRFGIEFFTKVWPRAEKVLEWFDKLDPKMKWLLTMLPLLAGGGMMAAGKLGNLALTLRLIGVGGGLAGKGISLFGGAAGSAVGPILALAAAAAQLYILDKIGGSLTEKLGGLFGQDWNKLGPVGAAWAMAKDWDPLAGKFGVGGVKRALTGKAAGAPASMPAAPAGAPATTWGPLAATPVYPGGGGGMGGGGGTGGGGGGNSISRGAVTLYQTIENVSIEGVKEINEASLRAALGKMATTEAGAVSG